MEKAKFKTKIIGQLYMVPYDLQKEIVSIYPDDGYTYSTILSTIVPVVKKGFRILDLSLQASKLNMDRIRLLHGLTKLHESNFIEMSGDSIALTDRTLKHYHFYPAY